MAVLRFVKLSFSSQLGRPYHAQGQVEHRKLRVIRGQWNNFKTLIVKRWKEPCKNWLTWLSRSMPLAQPHMLGRLVKSSLSKFIVLFVVSFFIVGKIKPAKKFEISFVKNKCYHTTERNLWVNCVLWYFCSWCLMCFFLFSKGFMHLVVVSREVFWKSQCCSGLVKFVALLFINKSNILLWPVNLIQLVKFNGLEYLTLSSNVLASGREDFSAYKLQSISTHNKIFWTRVFFWQWNWSQGIEVSPMLSVEWVSFSPQTLKFSSPCNL